MLGHSGRSFISCAAIGRSDAAIVIGVLLFQSDWNVWYPWTLPRLVTYSLEDGLAPIRQLLASSLGGLAVASVGTLDLICRDVLQAPRPGKRMEADRHLVQQVVSVLATVSNL